MIVKRKEYKSFLPRLPAPIKHFIIVGNYLGVGKNSWRFSH